MSSLSSVWKFLFLLLLPPISIVSTVVVAFAVTVVTALLATNIDVATINVVPLITANIIFTPADVTSPIVAASQTSCPSATIFLCSSPANLLLKNKKNFNSLPTVTYPFIYVCILVSKINFNKLVSAPFTTSENFILVSANSSFGSNVFRKHFSHSICFTSSVCYNLNLASSSSIIIEF